MYMHYASGGVGHYSVTLTDTPTDTIEHFAVDDDVMADPPAGLKKLEDECIEDDDIEDHSSDSETDKDDKENLDEDDHDLGAEDGEEGFLDAEDEEGYAAL